MSTSGSCLIVPPVTPHPVQSPAIQGLSHLTFVTRDLERAASLWTQGLGAREIYDSHARNFALSREKFFVLAGIWIAVMEGAPGSRSYRHVAFKVDAADLPRFEARLRALGVEPDLARPRIEGEGQSLYFHDHDDNLFELHSGTLDDRLRTYAGAGGGTGAEPAPG